MLVTNFAKPLQIALWRDQHTGRPGHRLDDDSRDGRGVMQGCNPLQLVRQLCAVIRLAA